MLKQFILAGSLAVCGLAQAADRPMYYTINATYTGFADYFTGQFDPARSQQLTAIGYDRNIDGMITVDEIGDFYFAGLNIPYYNISNYGRCGQDGPTSWCLSEFSYKGGNDLTFKASEYSTYAEAQSGSEAISGQYAYSYFHYTDGTSGGAYEGGVRWTPDTQLSVSVSISAVPEPATYAMFGAGLCAIGAVMRRRRKHIQE